VVTSQTQCPRCTGLNGAHFAFCFLAQAWERFMGPAYPWRAPATETRKSPEQYVEEARRRMLEEGEDPNRTVYAATEVEQLRKDLAAAQQANLSLLQRKIDVPNETGWSGVETSDVEGLTRGMERIERRPGSMAEFLDESVPPPPPGGSVKDVLEDLATGDWFEEWRQANTIAVGERDYTFLSDLHRDYARWCAEHKVPALGDTGFGRRMARLGYYRGRPKDPRTGAQMVAYYGVALRHSLVEPEAPAPEQAPEPEQQPEATVTPEPSAAPAPAPAPEPEPPAEGETWEQQRAREASWVRACAALNGLNLSSIARDLGRSQADLSNALTGRRPQEGFWQNVLAYCRNLPRQPEQSIDEVVPPAERKTTGSGRVPVEDQEEILAWLAEHTETAPDDEWTAVATLTSKYRETHPDKHEVVVGRYLGYILGNLGHRKDKAPGPSRPVPGHPGSGENPVQPYGRSIYYGIRLKGVEPAVPDVLPDWMQNPDTKERTPYVGDRPGREIPKEYREKIVLPLIEEQGWRYYRTGVNGKGKPRLVNPEGKSYSLANTPSDVKGLLFLRGQLRSRLGADL
jgi:hypothetical protein